MGKKCYITKKLTVHFIPNRNQRTTNLNESILVINIETLNINVMLCILHKPNSDIYSHLMKTAAVVNIKLTHPIATQKSTLKHYM